jgi:hypothetical protein
MPRDDTNTCTTAQGRARARSAGCPPARVRGGVESLRARDAFVVTPGPAGLKLAHRSKAPWPGWVLVGHGRAAGCCVGRLPERARQSHEGDVGLVGTEGTQHLALGCPRAPRPTRPSASCTCSPPSGWSTSSCFGAEVGLRSERAYPDLLCGLLHKSSATASRLLCRCAL